MEVIEGTDIVSQLVESAPVLGLSLGGVLVVARMLLRHHSGELAERVRVADERHKVYFAQLDAMNKATTNAIQDSTAALRENTQVLARVLDRLYPVAHHVKGTQL